MFAGAADLAALAALVSREETFRQDGDQKFEIIRRLHQASDASAGSSVILVFALFAVFLCHLSLSGKDYLLF